MALPVPKLEEFKEFFAAGKTEISTTTAFVNILRTLLRNRGIAGMWFRSSRTKRERLA